MKYFSLKKSSPKISVLLGVIFLVAVVFVYGFSYFSGLNNKTNESEIIIGWIGPLTGPLSFLGEENLRAINMAVEDYNTSRKGDEAILKVIASDDGYQTEKSLNLYKSMVLQYHPKVVFVSTYGAMFPISKRAKSDGVIIINPIDNDYYLSNLSKNVFLIAKQSEKMGQTIAQDIILGGKKTVLVCYNSSDEFMPSIAFGLKKRLENSGVQVVMHDYKSIEKETEIFDHIKLANALKPEANVFLGYSESGVLIKKYREIGLGGTFYVVNTAMENTAGESLNGSRVLQFTLQDSQSTATQIFIDNYQKKYNTNIFHPWVVFQAYDASNILIQAIGQMRGFIISDDSLRKALLGTKNFKGLSGDISINSDGSSVGINWGMYTYKKGQLIKDK